MISIIDPRWINTEIEEQMLESFRAQKEEDGGSLTVDLKSKIDPKLDKCINIVEYIIKAKKELEKKGEKIALCLFEELEKVKARNENKL